MKKTFLLLIAALMMTTSAYALGSEEIILFDKLPKAAQNTLKKSFDMKEAAVIKKISIPFVHTEYKVQFNNGVNVEFDDSGNWQEVKGATEGVPKALVPQKIIDYVAKKYPKQIIIAIEREDDDGFEIKLNNKIKLTFNSLHSLTDVERDDD